MSGQHKVVLPDHFRKKPWRPRCLDKIGELSSYFRAEVILGPGAFVRTAIGFSDYARAMKEKLLKELEGLVVSDLGPLPGPP